MDIRDFHFDLPPELIAQEPAAERSGARLLCLSRATGAVSHHAVRDLPALLAPGDLLVFNNTRVFPARLIGRRVPSGGLVECLLVSETVPETVPETGSETVPETVPETVSETVSGTEAQAETWEALMHPGQKLKPGARVVFEGDVRLHGEVVDWHHFGRRTIRLWTDDDRPVREAVDAIGHVPLPPYIKRPDRRGDAERYQTVFAKHRGSVAAPTAGLHFSDALLEALHRRGVESTEVTLHVGYGTFQPVRAQAVECHRMERERFEIPTAAADAINRARSQGRRVIAVGTTTTRTLESSGRAHAGRVVAEAGTTDLFIYPGFSFRVIDGLITNFHLPESSLLMLVCAFGGTGRVLAAYRAAVESRYRFYSYGDAMLTL